MTTVTRENIRYYLYYPKSYFDKPEKEYGILLFLHGGGESGNEPNPQTLVEPPKMLAAGEQFPFLIVAPRNPHEKKWWNTSAIYQLLDSIVRTNRVDENRIYLSGISRGGSAIWEMATQYPKKFAAISVVSGMAPVPYAHWIDKDLPIWVFHGGKDEIFSVATADEMVERLKKINDRVRYTRYHNMGHDIWDKVYSMDSLYLWMAAQNLKNN